MSTQAHTRGPWEACDRVVVVTVASHGYGTQVADCAVGGASGKQQLANARVVAAAPDMLAALKEAALQLEYLAEKFQPTSTGVAVLSRIERAIDKAEGRA